MVGGQKKKLAEGYVSKANFSCWLKIPCYVTLETIYLAWLRNHQKASKCELWSEHFLDALLVRGCQISSGDAKSLRYMFESPCFSGCVIMESVKRCFHLTHCFFQISSDRRMRASHSQSDRRTSAFYAEWPRRTGRTPVTILGKIAYPCVERF